MSRLSDKVEELIVDPRAMEIMGEDKPSQKQIRGLHQNGLDLMEVVRQLTKIAQSRFQLAENLCKHPNKSGYVCPDCGFDTE